MSSDFRIDRGPLTLGVALMAIGVVLVLARFDLVAVSEIAPWWPLLMVGGGLAVVVLGGRAEDRRAGLWIAVVGGWLLVNTLELGGFGWWSSWPLMVMLVGALQIAWPAGDQDRAGGFVTLAIGTWLLTSVRGYFGLDWGTSWPILLVLAGAGMVVKAFERARLARTQLLRSENAAGSAS